MVKYWILLGLATVGLFAQSFTFHDIAFLAAPPSTPPAGCTNSLTWMPAANTVDWYDTNGGSHLTTPNTGFETNCWAAVRKISFLGSVGNYITNIEFHYGSDGQVVNLEDLTISTENVLNNIYLDGLVALTNIAINFNPDLSTLNMQTDAPTNPITINLSVNALLDTVSGLSDALPYYTRITTLAINDCNFSDESQTNIACALYTAIVNNSISNGTFATENNGDPIADPSCIWAMTNYGWTISY